MGGIENLSDRVLIWTWIAEETQRLRKKEVVIRKRQGRRGMWMIESNHFG